MIDRNQSYATAPTAPAAHAFAIAPDDAADLPETTRALYIGTGGDVSAVLRSGAAVIFAAVGAGTVLPVQAIRIRASGTTATGLIGLC